jgi:prepilin-type N-terminal cleavage/methylation domain-containing protein
MCRICKRHNARGFTLVEIILVVAVIIILATALMTGVGDWIDKANAANEAVINQSAEVEQQINDSENMLADYNF